LCIIDRVSNGFGCLKLRWWASSCHPYPLDHGHSREHLSYPMLCSWSFMRDSSLSSLSLSGRVDVSGMAARGLHAEVKVLPPSDAYGSHKVGKSYAGRNHDLISLYSYVSIHS
jgi:hypothetical protein